MIRIFYLALMLACGAPVLADFEGGESDPRWGKSGWKGRMPDVAPVTNNLYAQKCGACHFAYQPGLLPERSWMAILDGLEDHFGKSVKLQPAEQRKLAGYFSDESADYAEYPVSRAIMESLGEEAIPLRVTGTPFFMQRHKKIPTKQAQDNPAVGSYTRCEACHRMAAGGSYNPHEVFIPGSGFWIK